MVVQGWWPLCGQKNRVIPIRSENMGSESKCGTSLMSIYAGRPHCVCREGGRYGDRRTGLSPAIDVTHIFIVYLQTVKK